MRLLNANIRSVGGIEQLSVDLKAGMNVLCGPNGIGKTTVLESIAHCFTIGSTNILKRHVSSVDSEIRIAFEHEGEPGEGKISFSTFEPNISTEVQGRHDLASHILSLKTARTFAYSPLNAIGKDAEKKTHVLWDDARNGVSLTDVKNWFANRFLYSAHAGALNPGQIANFELAKKCFAALDPNVRFLRVNPSTNEILVSSAGGEIYYEYLSSGFKSCLAIMLGIIKEVELRFPLKPNVQEFKGVVLIDEIELHLHPDWQSKIAKTLIDLFPSIQFVATTHSPHVIQSAEPNQILALERIGNSIVRRPLPSSKYGFRGWSLDEVLTDVMGMQDTRSQEFLRLMREFGEALDNSDRARAERAYGELNESLHPANHIRKLLRLQLAAVIDSEENDQA